MYNLTDKDENVEKLVERLNRGEIYYFDVPEEYRLHPTIVQTERELGIRQTKRKGYNVLENSLFVEESVIYRDKLGKVAEKSCDTLFQDFASFYDFAEGNIYENSCYYGYVFSQEDISKYSIDLSRINFTAFIDYDIDSYTAEMTEEEKKLYENTEKVEYIYKKLLEKYKLIKLRKSYNQRKKEFYVCKRWEDESGNILKEYKVRFKYFCDFVYFLKNDLSDMDLLFCDGLQNISDLSGINLKNTSLRSGVCDKLNVQYEVVPIEPQNFDNVEKNEIETERALTAGDIEEFDRDRAREDQIVYYVSDLHILHRLKKFNCRSNNDVIYTIQNLIDMLLDNMPSRRFWFANKNVILLGGDISSDFSIFTLFVKRLRQTLDEQHFGINIVFILGNHELWEFKGNSLEEIVEKYREVIEENGMYLLQNELFIKRDDDIEIIKEHQLLNLSESELKNRVRTARFIIFGGIGFAGYNEEFNANQLIYRQAINRNQEIEESKKFELLYNKICKCLSSRQVIVLTHMPQSDWCSNQIPNKGFIYINGHNHRNLFYDDGDYRIYADNQIGYKQKSCRLKFLFLEDDYDYFSNYGDGIYEIEREDYLNFYRGKNISPKFSREYSKLYMLKKNGYYLFIMQSKNGKLNILNGGAINGLDKADIKYYFDNMDIAISTVKRPLDKYSEYQRQISDAIKKIGGRGTIHGSIIDIDFYNHIYVNPIDSTITAYWALDMIDKVIYKNVFALLKSRCPELYSEYLKQISDKSSNIQILEESKSVALFKEEAVYLSTDIYKTSREIKKMQKLESNILSIWVEPNAKQKAAKLGWGRHN